MTRESLKPNIFPPDSKNYGSVSLQIPDVDDLDDNDLYNINEDTNTSERLSIIFKFSYPVILAFLLSVSGNCIILYFAGYISHLGDDTATFGGVSLAITFTNITLSSVVDGLSTAVETLSSQYNGAKNYRMVGLVLNRSIIVLLLISLPIMVIWLYFDTIFTLIGISHDMIAVVGEFISWRFLSVPVEVLNLSYEKYLMSMGIMQPSLKACCLFNVSLVLMNYIFVCVLECGVRGIALAYVLSMCMELATLVLLSVNHPCVKRTLVAPDSESFQELGSFLLFGLSGCVMLCAEWWAYVRVYFIFLIPHLYVLFIDLILVVIVGNINLICGCAWGKCCCRTECSDAAVSDFLHVSIRHWHICEHSGGQCIRCRQNRSG